MRPPFIDRQREREKGLRVRLSKADKKYIIIRIYVSSYCDRWQV